MWYTHNKWPQGHDEGSKCKHSWFVAISGIECDGKNEYSCWNVIGTGNKSNMTAAELKSSLYGCDIHIVDTIHHKAWKVIHTKSGYILLMKCL